MRTIYIDSDFKCHVNNDGAMRPFETDFLDGMCDAFVEGHRFVPDGESWTDEHGTVFEGKTLFPWVDSSVLFAYQEEHERNRANIEQLQAEAEEANAILDELIGGVNDVQQE